MSFIEYHIKWLAFVLKPLVPELNAPKNKKSSNKNMTLDVLRLTLNYVCSGIKESIVRRRYSWRTHILQFIAFSVVIIHKQDRQNVCCNT
jgi:hypothetical protein